jgi:ribosomal protein S12 methylthiotransferase
MGSVRDPGARVYIHTLGCPKNEADSRAVMRRLVEAGVTIVDEPQDATHILLNTCGFVSDAKEESIEAILNACAEYPDRTVMAMGCLVERYRDALAAGIPEVAAWFGVVGPEVDDRLRNSLLGSRTARSASSQPTSPRTAHAYLKISDGCDQPCTFCAIPGIKGPYGSVSTAQIVREAEACLSEGARELTLVGQDTARWSSDGLDLAGLVDLLAGDERVDWIRIMYLQPQLIQDSFLRFMGSHGKLCHYLDVPFQHSHPDILRRMGRPGDGEGYLNLLEEARRLMPDLSVRSSFIVGFPGETDRHFDHLLDFVERAGFDYAGGFAYSPEEGTEAVGFTSRVSRATARRRLNGLNDLLWETSERKHRKMVGTTVEVMIDGIDPEESGEATAAVGRTRGQAPEVDGVTYVEGRLPDGIGLGDVVPVKVRSVVGWDLVGEYCAP